MIVVQEFSKRLEYFPPRIQANGILMIRYTEDVIEEGFENWKSTLVGCFIEKTPSFPVVQSQLRGSYQKGMALLGHY